MNDIFVKKNKILGLQVVNEKHKRMSKNEHFEFVSSFIISLFSEDKITKENLWKFCNLDIVKAYQELYLKELKSPDKTKIVFSVLSLFNNEAYCMSGDTINSGKTIFKNDINDYYVMEDCLFHTIGNFQLINSDLNILKGGSRYKDLFDFFLFDIFILFELLTNENSNVEINAQISNIIDKLDLPWWKNINDDTFQKVITDRILSLYEKNKIIKMESNYNSFNSFVELNLLSAYCNKDCFDFIPKDIFEITKLIRVSEKGSWTKSMFNQDIKDPYYKLSNEMIKARNSDIYKGLCSAFDL